MHDLASIESSDCLYNIFDLSGLEEGICLRLLGCCWILETGLCLYEESSRGLVVSNAALRRLKASCLRGFRATFGFEGVLDAEF